MRNQTFQMKRLGIGLVLVLLATLLLGVSSARAFAAQNTAVVHPDPLSVGMRSGEEKEISIAVENVKNLYGIEFQIRFDPKIVQVQDADKSKAGVQVAIGDWLQDGFVAANEVDNSKGTISFAATLLNPAPALDGDGIVATINFRGKGDGTSALKLSKAILATRDATEIDSQVQDGAIGVSALGQAPVIKNNPAVGNPSNSNNSNSTFIAGIPNLVLVGAAGVGVLAFVVALAVLLGIVLFRRRA